MLTLFLAAAALLFFVFLGYPLLLILLSCFMSRPVRKGTYEPSVSLIISAYNEEEVIRAKLENSLALAYPKDKLEILVCSDGSTDRTDEIVRSFGDRVRLVRVEGRVGKPECQNEGVRQATGEVVVFSDANSMYDAQALIKLMSNFHDPAVGVVCGELRYVNNGKSEEGLYWKLERLLKKGESALGSCLGANGAIYAMRKQLFKPLPPESCSDFIEPFAAIEQGYRVIYEPNAFCVETPEDNSREFVRKRRIVTNSLQSLFLIKDFLNPFAYGWYSVALWSHKILRWYAFVFLILILFANLFLLETPFFQAVLFLQIAFYVLAYIGIYVPHKLFSIPYYFVVVNLASLLAFFDMISGRKITAWEKIR